MFRTIVVGIDGSEPSKRAFDAACHIARAFEGELHVVHALEGRDAEERNRQMHEEPEKNVGEAVIDAAVARAGSLGVALASTTASEGDPFEEVMTIVGLYSADLVVTGRRGLGGISGLFAGSTSQKIAKNAQCAFLSVK
ncbi:MAG: universal stress protein [Roseobacter sp.]